MSKQIYFTLKEMQEFRSEAEVEKERDYWQTAIDNYFLFGIRVLRW
jgi:hypothetical protein